MDADDDDDDDERADEKANAFNSRKVQRKGAQNKMFIKYFVLSRFCLFKKTREEAEAGPEVAVAVAALQLVMRQKQKMERRETAKYWGKRRNCICSPANCAAAATPTAAKRISIIYKRCSSFRCAAERKEKKKLDLII